ncbi:Gfo/Idh/MocA family oxidoreductase [Steroidobacter sp. S1-65]|uniref:Gfo/Idh/MocA family oxidoreductase n=1 Tax=Steroidobacter gossypii TaxID=2805490 RepID=A0ABS1X149_9GAMM|nr:Gfo/Idh/MocA family oxidoreductase [Steroidobacter gossypii]MBM0106966.1 Gfo/Idh/MocA family oxidoreductase [Steroidobacter gossypii]
MRSRQADSFSRRTFGKTLLGVSLPLILPSHVLAAGPNSRIRVGQIGCGRIARDHDMVGVLKSGMADIVAVCDVDANRAADGKKRVEELYRQIGGSAPQVSVHKDYREILERKDIDAVVISTPDHWHAEPALAAVLAGKDVYLQKPFTMTIAEGIVLRDAVARTKRILQVGSQQRSWKQFRQAAELIRSGRIGQVRRVEIGLPIDPTAPDDPVQPVPEGLDYAQWLGPAQFAYYTEQRVHPRQGYSRPGWLRNEAFCLGMITGWGSHHYDTMHWALDLESSGPSRVEGSAEFPTNKIWNVHGAYDVKLTYPGDIKVHVSDKHNNGLKFFGDDGWIWVTRDGTATASDPSSGKTMPPLDASDQRLLDPKGLKVELPRSDSHHKNWLESVRSRKQPLAPAHIAHRSGSACIVSWIAMKLQRPLTWDVKSERFVNDEQANALLSRPERAPYGIGRLIKS